MGKQDSQPQQEQTNIIPGAGKPVIADVFATSASGGGVDFRLKWRFKDEDDEHDDPIDIPPRKNSDSGTMIHFTLHDSTNRHLEFDAKDPIWVSRTDKPTSASKDPQIPHEQIDPASKLLKVFDANSEFCDLLYTLNFNDRQGVRVPFDPMIRNGGISP